MTGQPTEHVHNTIEQANDHALRDLIRTALHSVTPTCDGYHPGDCQPCTQRADQVIADHAANQLLTTPKSPAEPSALAARMETALAATGLAALDGGELCADIAQMCAQAAHDEAVADRDRWQEEARQAYENRDYWRQRAEATEHASPHGGEHADLRDRIADAIQKAPCSHGLGAFACARCRADAVMAALDAPAAKSAATSSKLAADLRDRIADAIRKAAETHEPACGEDGCECDVAVVSPMYGPGPTTRVEGSPQGIADAVMAVVLVELDQQASCGCPEADQAYAQMQAHMQAEIDRQTTEIARLNADLNGMCEDLNDALNHNDQTCEAVADRDRWRQRAEAAERQLAQLRAVHQQIGDL